MNATTPARRAALYLRISSDRSVLANQLAEVEQLARARGYEPVVYEEVESAVKARPVFDCMMADCVHRPMPIADSGPSRSLIPVEADHRFRSKPIAERIAR
jgi:hypothetical protein